MFERTLTCEFCNFTSTNTLFFVETEFQTICTECAYPEFHKEQAALYDNTDY